MITRPFIVGALLLLPMMAAAQATPRDEMVSGFARCLGIADERTFLDCVYGAAQPVRAELGLPPAPASQVRLVPQAPAGAPAPTLQPASQPPAPEARGGFFSKVFGGGKVETQAVAMASYSVNRDGIFTVTLNNGEVWGQEAGDTNFAHWRKPASTYVVTVVSGALGSSNLQVKGESGFYKVKRLH